MPASDSVVSEDMPTRILPTPKKHIYDHSKEPRPQGCVSGAMAQAWGWLGAGYELAWGGDDAIDLLQIYVNGRL